MTDPLLTIDDATREFRVSAKTIRRRLTAGEIDGAYKRPGTRGPEWVMPRSSLVQAGFDVRDAATPAALPEDEGARADYWARRALDAEAALRRAAADGPPSAPRRRPGIAGVAAVAALVLLALAVGLLLGRSTGDYGGRDTADGALEAAASLLGSLTGDGDPIGHVGSVAADALPEQRRAVPIEELEDARQVRYVLVAGRASARPVVAELEERARALLRLPAADVVVFDTGPLAAVPEDAPLAEASDGDQGGDGGTGDGAAHGGDPEVTQGSAPGPVAPAPGGEAQIGGSGAASGSVGGPGSAVVAPGESFWTIAEAIAAERGADVATTWADLVAANADRLVEPGNPDLLHVGQTLRIPAQR